MLHLHDLIVGDQISRVSKMLADEYGTASNIKSRVNRLSVLGAITSVQHRLKLYTKVPPNGLVRLEKFHHNSQFVSSHIRYMVIAIKIIAKFSRSFTAEPL